MYNEELCKDCKEWKTKHKVLYSGDGSEVVLSQTPEGKGNCRILDQLTDGDFGCRYFDPYVTTEDQTILDVKAGEPWQHSKWGSCPECQSRGSFPVELGGGVCGRCQGTGRVRYYEDGYIGEEKTRLHPKEAEAMKKKRQKPKEPEGSVLAPMPKDSGAL